jgi:hypothetical protein
MRLICGASAVSSFELERFQLQTRIGNQ